MPKMNPIVMELYRMLLKMFRSHQTLKRIPLKGLTPSKSQSRTMHIIGREEVAQVGLGMKARAPKHQQIKNKKLKLAHWKDTKTTLRLA
jgi:hypothetical protein